MHVFALGFRKREVFDLGMIALLLLETRRAQSHTSFFRSGTDPCAILHQMSFFLQAVCAVTLLSPLVRASIGAIVR